MTPSYSNFLDTQYKRREDFICYLIKIDELDESEEAERTVVESADYHALINIVELLKQKLIGKHI